MCGTCGCGDVRAGERQGTLVRLERRILGRNDELARRNRALLEERSILALNVVSSPGAGKTTLLERTIRDLGSELEVAVIEGDQATDRDAERIRAAGARAVQINTGTGCHLDASMVSRAIEELEPAPGSVLFIENVGNLVCPALFDLGERARVLVASVTEGEDKPIKYPHMFKSATVLVLNKTDLEAAAGFDGPRFLGFARQMNPSSTILRVSATRGDGLDGWYGWLRAARSALLDRRS